jgi:hypothetical protein
MYYIIIFLLLLYIFFIVNSIIWLKTKPIVNINDKIIKYIIYIDFIVFTSILLFIIYIYIYNKRIKIL